MTRRKPTPPAPPAHSFFTEGPSLTKQDGAQTPAQVARAFLHGQPLPEQRPPVYADLSRFNAVQLRDSLIELRNEFMDLGAEARLAFNNDETEYMEFLQEHGDEIDANGLRATLVDFLNPEPEEHREKENAAPAVSEEREPLVRADSGPADEPSAEQTS